jgi:tRNA pseudouridine32 synthase/23S rRNA pseudouridine746 synthase
MNGDLSYSKIWEDEQILVINKPSGLLTIPDGYHDELTSLSWILIAIYNKIWVVHRLDKETSGVILFAKSALAHRNLSLQFQNRAVEKVYHGIVYGYFEWNSINIQVPLRVNGDRKHRTIPDEVNGKPASTDFNVIDRKNEFSLIDARPHTGYRHQIRSHLASAGCTLLCDNLYRAPQQELRDFSTIINHLALHACSITFQHPQTQERVTFQAAYPHEFQSAINLLDLSNNCKN